MDEFETPDETDDDLEEQSEEESSDDDVASEFDDDEPSPHSPTPTDLFLEDEKLETPTLARQRPHTTPVSKFVYETSSQAFRDYTNLFRGAVHQSQSLEQTMQWESECKSFDRVLQQMIISRGFMVFSLPNSTDYIPEATIKKLLAVIGHHPNMTIAFNPRGGILLTVHVKGKSKLGIETARRIEKVCKRINPLQLVIITRQGVTPSAKKLFVGLLKNTQFFLTTELEKNYSLHKLVPRQTALDAKETAALLKKYSIQLMNLPKMNKIDPIAKFFGWSSGTVVKSIRKFGEALEPYVYYRVVK
jgi:DNA-directed RNA polymerase subunit H (RpoH/RPB5)